MDRNYPGTGFGDLGAGAGWSYERSAKASLVYGSSRSSHPEAELLHRQAYATPHPLQGYATNHHPGSTGQGGAWGAAGRSLGLSGLFDTGLHHASPSAPDASVMNLISALESRGPQPPPSASSLLSQFRTPSWQTAMHTPAPPELFISGALPGSGSFPSASALSAYQHPASFSSRSFPTGSLSLQDTPTFSPTSNGLLSPHDPLLHIKAPSQSSLGFDRLLTSQGAAAAAYRGSQDPTSVTSAQASSARHLQSHQFNLLSSQLQDQSSQLYNASVFSSAQPQPQSNSAQERAVPRQDSVIKHYQRPTPAQSQLSSSAAHSLQHYLSCGGAGYQQIAPHHRHAGLSCSPLGYGSPVPPVKTPTSSLTGQTPPQQQTQSYSPNQPPPSHLAQSYGGFSSPQAQDLSSGQAVHQAAEHLQEEAAVAQEVGTLAREEEREIGYPDTRGPSSQPQSYHSTSSKTKADTSMLGVGSQRSQEEVDDDDEFLIQHLLQAQASPAPQGGHHHPQQQPQQTSQQTQSQPQSGPSDTDSGKGLTYDMGKSSEERYHPQSVIRTHSATSAGSVVHYGRGDPYSQHPLAPQHSSHSQLVSSHSQIPSHSQMELQKKPQERAEIPYPRKTPEIQQQHSQAAASLMDSPTDQSRQPPHLLQSVLSHTTRNKLEPHQQQHHKMDSHQQHQQQHHKMDSHRQHQQHHKMDSHSQQQQHSISQQQAVAAAHYNHGPPTHQHDQSQVKQSSVVSSLDMLERSLSQTSSTDQHSASELHSFLSEPDMGLSTPPHMHHLSQHHQPLSSQLTPQQSQLDQQRAEQHQFDNVSPVEKADQNQQSNRFVPLTSICFPDSLLQDEDRSFFPGMEDMFCAEDYKSSCAGGAGPGQEEMNDSHTGQEGMDSMKGGQGGGGAGGSGGGSYDMMGHHGGDQGYEPYCHGLEEPSNNTMTLDLDSLKTHELPSTVNTEQLGLIQSQGPAMGMGTNPAGPNNPGAKMSSGPGGPSQGAGSGGLQSPIFCSSRPKKLLKSSSFHLLKERRDPNTLPKKSYAQEYEFEDDEDKADQPADIRLNSRRLPDLLPDLVSSCRKGGGGGSLSPLMGDIDFYHASGYSSMGSHSLMPQEGPKKRGRKPTRPKRDGPPRPRGRPRIRPMPEPYTPRGMMGEMAPTTPGAGFTPIPPLKIKLPIGTLSSSDALLRTDSLSGTDPALSDGSVGSAPSLGLSPGPPCSTESNRSHDKNKQKSQMMSEGVDDEGLEERGDEKDSDSKAGFVASFLDFLKTGKRPPGLDISPGMEHDNGETSPFKSGGLRQLSPGPPPPPLPPFGDSEGNGGLTLGNCHSPKRLEDELKRNLETLPSFSSDEEDSVGKNQDLQKSISSAISALYDTPQLTSNMQSPLPPSPPQPQSQATPSPLTPSLQPPTLSPQPAMHTPHDLPQSNEPDVLQLEDDRDMDENKEEEEQRSAGGDEEREMTEEREPQLETLGAPSLDALLPELPSERSLPCRLQNPPPSPEEAPAPKITSLHLAQKQEDAAIAGESEEDESESGGEGIFRERDEFVVRVEDIRTLKLALQMGREPPPIWRVQKALLQKFSPEIKDGQRQFCATSNYLGYFGDAKRRYQRIYVKFLENVNKKDYVRVCSRRPWRRATPALRRPPLPRMASPPTATQAPPKVEKEERVTPPVQREQREQREKTRTTTTKELREKKEAPAAAKPTKVKAEPPPKKRKKWLKEIPSSSDSDSSEEAASENEMPVKGGVNNRAMREMFRSYVEMLVSTALDPDMIQALEDTDDELYLPPMRKIDSIISEQKRRLLRRVSMSSQHQEFLHAYPQILVDPLDSGLVRVRLSGDAYNRKTLNRVKKTLPKPQDLKLSGETHRIYSLFHSLHHYKYHTFLQCKKETNSIEQATEDPGQEEVVQQCMANQSWLDSLFSSFIELLTLSTKA
ncbi:Proline-rich protein 12 [Dissostichus eleginoides]|uniref:Proline-rich protein 12 n=1 Tax=Dissostichus eleginoides TaxID=100907 RepID=A0AAD9F1D8_DISEL|nr:Proline-rich protein 12 [Dissostichus eleginoides]